MKGIRYVFPVVLVSAIWFITPAPLRADEISDLKEQLEAAKQLIMNLEQRIEQLEQKQAPGVQAAAPGASDRAESAEPEMEAEGSFEIYGFAQTDVIQDFNRVDPDWNATLRPSKIPTAEGVYGSDGETVFSVRQTRLGVASDLPTPYGDFGAKLEIDFFGVGSDAGQTTVHPRHFYGELGSLLVGQTHSLFMDINVFPNTIDYWGPPGMVFLRHPQVRWTVFSGDYTFAVALEEPGNDVSWAVGDAPELYGSLQSKNELPDLTGQINYLNDWGYIQLGAIVRQVGFETTGGVRDLEDDSLGWGFNLSSNINTFGSDRLILSTVYGEAIASYMNDGGNDLIVVDGQAQTLPLLGVVAYYDHYWTDSLSSSVGYSFTRVDNNDRQTPDSFKLGQYSSVNLLWTPTANTMFGVEYLWGALEDKNGDTGEDHRVQFSFKYSFDQLFPVSL
ncbi:MAG: porin [Desulfofustis sp.]|nr:porin [Desulfofustis sp.]